MGTDTTTWKDAGEDGGAFRAQATAQPGWYWILRPHLEGPGRYDPTQGVVCPIHVFADGRVSSPLANLRTLEMDHLAPKGADGRRFPSRFAGPLDPGPEGPTVSTASGRAEGSPPPVPGWYWCRTNPEAPLIHVDEAGIGPIFLDRSASGEVHVWSTATLDGEPVDIGELGFSEPLTSPGGVIDASGELGRHTVTFFGPIVLPERGREPSWPRDLGPRTGVVPPRATEVLLHVPDVEKGRAFYRALGLLDTGDVLVAREGLSVRLVQGFGSGGSAVELRVDELGWASALERGAVESGGTLRLEDPGGRQVILRRGT